jgi:hypothetical protein
VVVFLPPVSSHTDHRFHDFKEAGGQPDGFRFSLSGLGMKKNTVSTQRQRTGPNMYHYKVWVAAGRE